jgi:hypothetical protein
MELLNCVMKTISYLIFQDHCIYVVGIKILQLVRMEFLLKIIHGQTIKLNSSIKQIVILKKPYIN